MMFTLFTLLFPHLHLKGMIQSETRCLAQQNVTVAVITPVFCLFPFFLFSANHTPFAGMFPCACWGHHIRQMPAVNLPAQFGDSILVALGIYM
jgi:hypothetical protein